MSVTVTNITPDKKIVISDLTPHVALVPGESVDLEEEFTRHQIDKSRVLKELVLKSMVTRTDIGPPREEGTIAGSVDSFEKPHSFLVDEDRHVQCDILSGDVVVGNIGNIFTYSTDTDVSKKGLVDSDRHVQVDVLSIAGAQSTFVFNTGTTNLTNVYTYGAGSLQCSDYTKLTLYVDLTTAAVSVNLQVEFNDDNSLVWYPETDAADIPVVHTYFKSGQYKIMLPLNDVYVRVGAHKVGAGAVTMKIIGVFG